MKLEVNLSKRFVVASVVIGLIIVGLVGVVAYKSPLDWTKDPAVFGHSVDEIDWAQTIQGNITVKGSINASYFIGEGTGIGSQWTSVTDGINYAGGNVGIGIANPTEKLHVIGNVLANAFFYSSDIRLKEGIYPLYDSLGKVLQLDGVSFKFKGSDRTEIGLIAQDVEKVFPEIVLANNNGFKTVDYGKLSAVLIEALKQQQIEIEELRNEIESLKS